MTFVHPALVCPRCRGPLEHDATSAASHVGCRDCGRRFPVHGGIPVLLHDPHAEVTEWCFRAHDYLADNNDARDKLLAQVVAGGELHPLTRRRAELLREHLVEHRERIMGIAKAGGIEPRVRTVADRERVPGESTLTAYYHQIHRDWGWDGLEEDEAHAAVAAVEAVLPSGFALGETLVLGAGACRLPWELHRRRGASSTLALDINPLPFFIARRIIEGETMQLFELPVRPRYVESALIDRTLSAGGVTAEGFAFAFADGLDPPVRPHAFDTVLTPWFIDQIPKNFADLLPTLKEVLKVGGTWINHGPLIYHPAHTSFVHRYCVDEVLGMVEAAGWTVESHTFERMPYMVSPVGSQGRTEMVLTFRATLGPWSAAKPAPKRERPRWLDDPSLPIERLAGLDTYAAPHPMFAFIAQAIDGQRSAADIGRLLSERHGVPATAATEGVQAALAEILRALGD